jgi:thiol-disulfide isomerase/thioredoxin
MHSCKNAETEKLPTILIFEKAPQQLSVKFDGSAGTTSTMADGEIIFVDSNGLKQYFSSNREQDTLILYCSDDYVEVCHLHKALENLYFYIKSGDTVLFTYDDQKYPSLRSYTSDQLTKQYNFQKSISQRLSYFDYEPLTLFSSYDFWRIYTAVTKEKLVWEWLMPRYVPMDTVEQQAKHYLQEYAQLLEKQCDEKMFSSDVCDYYHYLLRKKKMDYERSLLFYVADSSKRTLAALDQIYDGYFNDEHYRYMSYLHGVDQYLFTYKYLVKFPIVSKNNGDSGYSVADYRIAFDSICKRTNIPPKTHSYMLSQLLDNIIEYFSVADIEHYTEKYITLTGDSLRIKNKLIENGITETKNDDIQLRDDKGNEFSFDDIRKQFLGKVIYIDFWASWCAPCRSAMPEASKLRKDYEGKDVVFLYLAFNDREEAWKNAVKQLKLNDSRAENYFIVNSKSSKMIQELKVEFIPRYVIYDKSGKIVYYKAPAPGAEARKALDELLK